MYSSYSLTKYFVSVPLLTIQLLLIHSVSSLNLTNSFIRHKCRSNQGRYEPGSQYEINFNSVTRELSTEIFRDGFTHRTHGKAPNSVTVIFQCRGDSYGSYCRSCAATAVAMLQKRCKRNKGAIIWYDQCFIDVSMINDPTPRKLNIDTTFPMYNPNNVRGDTKLFIKKTSDFLYKLTLKADKPDVDGLNLLYYAAGVENIGTNKLYAMVQCAKDVANCTGCLEWSIKEIPKYSDIKQGARVMGTSCNLRYELYPFLRT